MANALRKLNRRQLLELLIAQGKDLEEQKAAAQAAQERVAELEAKLERLAAAALDAAAIVDEAKQEADVYRQTMHAEAEQEAAAILAKARSARPADEPDAEQPGGAEED